MAKIITRDTLTHESQNTLNVKSSSLEFLRSREIGVRSKATIRYYKHILPRIIQWLESEHVTTWNQVTPELIREYLQSLKDKGHNQGGVHAYFRTLRALMNWVWDEYDLEVRNPITKVKCADRAPEPIAGITMEEVEEILAACRFNKFPERDRAVFCILVDTGIRKSELSNLKMEDVNVTESSITIHLGKGGKTRKVYFGKECRKAIRRYLSRLTDIQPHDSFWLTITGDPLAPSGLRQILRRTQENAGMKKVHEFHAFRRCFAIERKRNGDDDITISRALGHSSLEVTKRYLAFTPDDDRDFAMRASPMDNRRRNRSM